MTNYRSLNHTKWECQYHVVFIPKYRRKALYGGVRRALGDVLRRLAEHRESRVEEGHLLADHVHMMVSIPPKYSVAHYWYDPVSGLWGLEGGPSLGQTIAGVDVGGRLRRDASGGRTGVVVNGREIHPTELQFLVRLFGVVNPGRYWLNADGIGGYEGGPARFNLRAAAGGSRRGSILGHSDTGSVIGGMYLAPGAGRE